MLYLASNSCFIPWPHSSWGVTMMFTSVLVTSLAPSPKANGSARARASTRTMLILFPYMQYLLVESVDDTFIVYTLGAKSARKNSSPQQAGIGLPRRGGGGPDWGGGSAPWGAASSSRPPRP